MILSMITPVLGSLTATYSDETIILDYAIFVFVHLIYYDFEIIDQKPQHLNQVQSKSQQPNHQVGQNQSANPVGGTAPKNIKKELKGEQPQ